jgi:hypothetical protein
MLISMQMQENIKSAGLDLYVELISVRQDTSRQLWTYVSEKDDMEYIISTQTLK